MYKDKEVNLNRYPTLDTLHHRLENARGIKQRTAP